MLNIGVISTWHVHTDDYAGQFIRSGKAVIKAVWDFDAAAGSAWAKAHDAEFIADYNTFLARQDIQAVVCNAPTTMHFELLEKAAKAGKHIFTEKLLTASMKECVQLCQTIQESGVIFTISLPLRTDPKMRFAKKLIEEGTLGRISGARMRRSHSGVSDNWLPERWFDTRMTGGGALMDLGAHPVYLMSFFFGAPKRISCLMSNPYGTSSDENAFAIAEFEGGVIGSMETAFITYGVPDILEIYGSEGSLFIHGDDVRLSTKPIANAGAKEAQPIRLPDPIPSPILQFLEACISGTKTPEHLGLHDALIMTRIIEASYDSNRTNSTVKL